MENEWSIERRMRRKDDAEEESNDNNVLYGPFALHGLTVVSRD